MSEAGEDAVMGVRRTTLAARLKALYGNVDQVDAFVGMLAEPHEAGSEFGQLQLAIWKRQFEALRDGDRFYCANDPLLTEIEQAYGITYRHTLAELIRLNVDDAAVANDVFKAPEEAHCEQRGRAAQSMFRRATPPKRALHVPSPADPKACRT